MSVYRLPHGQFGYSGHVINLPQDTVSFVNSLPRLPSALDVLIVRKEGAAQSHRDFRVRKSVVLRALQWLIQNNTYYRHITINTEALALLPEDGNLAGLCSIAMDPSTTDQEESQESIDDPYTSHLERSFVPLVTQRLTEQETIRESVHQSTSQQPLPWPTIGASPVNEFNTEGYMSQAFPDSSVQTTLLPAQHGTRHSRTTLQLQTGSSMNASANLWMLSISASLEPPITGCVTSGSIVEVHMSMALPGLLEHQM